jgi:hypothetical protein
MILNKFQYNFIFKIFPKIFIIRFHEIFMFNLNSMFFLNANNNFIYFYKSLFKIDN